MLVFLFEMLCMGAGVALVERLLFVYVEAPVSGGGLAGSTTLCGLSVGVTVLFELPIFTFTDTLLRVPGRNGLFLLAMAAYAARTYGYTVLTHDSRFWLLALELLHGVTFASLWISAVDFVKVHCCSIG
jgi:hypothetical protein